MKRITTISLICMLCHWCSNTAMAQGLHLSQYYNTPMLVNPANTALTADDDYRIGANYRSQWSSVPVPYKTFSAWADFHVFEGSSMDNPNWLGLGGSLFTDKAGDGNLALTSFNAYAAYHLHLSDVSMLSFGMSAGTVQRSVDFSKLTFDTQWDGETFSPALPNGELPGLKKTSYADVGAGVNYAYFPSDNLFVQLGASMQHLNRPSETFYGTVNKLGLRPAGNLDVLIRAGSRLIINPSAYFTYQKGASEFLGGSLLLYNMAGARETRSSLILGAYTRITDAVIAAVGYEYGNFRFMSTYDVTTSKLAPYNNSNGAVEISVIWHGLYPHNGGIGHKVYNCPRFF